MNAAEARSLAEKALANRLDAWGVDHSHGVACDFMADLVREGWIWMPPSNRPSNARAGSPDECRTHPGEHATTCRSCAVERYRHERDPEPTTTRRDGKGDYLTGASRARAHLHPEQGEPA